MEQRKPYLLIADDDAEFRGSLAGFLRSENFEVAEAANGAEALQQIRGKRRPDLVILDLSMPTLSGWEILAIREADPVLLLIPMIVLSGETRKPAEVGPNAFLTKPVRRDALLDLVRTIMDQSNPDPERTPRRSEPWSVDRNKPNVLRNSFGHVVAFVASAQEARRIVAAVNGSSRVSTEALEQGIIDKGLECLYDLNRYDTDPEYRKTLETSGGEEPIFLRRREIVSMLDRMSYSRRPRS